MPIKTLDSLSIESPTLVKIDVQSSETKVIEGGQKTLFDARIILVEVSFRELKAQIYWPTTDQKVRGSNPCGRTNRFERKTELLI